MGMPSVMAMRDAAAAIRELKARLEIDPRTKYDGIATRDETIRLLEGKLAAIEAARAEADKKVANEEGISDLLLAQLERISKMAGKQTGEACEDAVERTLAEREAELVSKSYKLESVATTADGATAPEGCNPQRVEAPHIAHRIDCIGDASIFPCAGCAEAALVIERERAEKAEAELARLREHADDMALYAENPKLGTADGYMVAVDAYRADYPKE